MKLKKAIPHDFEVVFSINRGKRALILWTLVGFLFLVNAGIFFYANHLMKSSFCKWTGIVSALIGILFVLHNVRSFSKPFIIASRKGVWMDILMFGFGQGLFVPWSEVRGIMKEKWGVFGNAKYPFKAYRPTECLAFEIGQEYYRKIPMCLKGVYGKHYEKLFFAKGSISVAVETAVEKLCAIKKSSN